MNNHKIISELLKVYKSNVAADQNVNFDQLERYLLKTLPDNILMAEAIKNIATLSRELEHEQIK
jgi:hypothetical protein